MMRSVIEQPLVQDYLDQLDAALAALPAGQRVELRAQIVAHLEDALTSTPPEPVADVLTRLGSPEELVAAAVPAAPGEPVHRPRRRVVAALVVLALLLAAGFGYLSARGHGRPAAVSVPQLLGLTSGDARQALDGAGLDMTIRRAGSQQPSGVVVQQVPPAGRLIGRGSHVTLTVSTGPLLPGLPASTEPVAVSTGSVSGVPWTFWAQITSGTPRHPTTMPGAALRCSPTGVQLATALLFRHAPAWSGGSGPCGTPADLRPITVSGIGPGTGLPHARMLLGVLTVRATSIRITFTEHRPPLSVPTVTNPALPGLRFVAVNVPSWNIHDITALTATGQTLAHTNWH